MGYADFAWLDNTECDTVLGQGFAHSRPQLHPHVMCAHDLISKNGKYYTVCQGDSGSPVLYKGHTPTLKAPADMVQIGIVSLGASGCTPLMPSYFVSLEYYDIWIMNSVITHCPADTRSTFPDPSTYNPTNDPPASDAPTGGNAECICDAPSQSVSITNINNANPIIEVNPEIIINPDFEFSPEFNPVISIDDGSAAAVPSGNPGAGAGSGGGATWSNGINITPQGPPHFMAGQPTMPTSSTTMPPQRSNPNPNSNSMPTLRPTQKPTTQKPTGFTANPTVRPTIKRRRLLQTTTYAPSNAPSFAPTASPTNYTNNTMPTSPSTMTSPSAPSATSSTMMPTTRRPTTQNNNNNNAAGGTCTCPNGRSGVLKGRSSGNKGRSSGNKGRSSGNSALSSDYQKQYAQTQSWRPMMPGSDCTTYGGLNCPTTTTTTTPAPTTSTTG